MQYYRLAGRVFPYRLITMAELFYLMPFTWPRPTVHYNWMIFYDTLIDSRPTALYATNSSVVTVLIESDGGRRSMHELPRAEWLVLLRHLTTCRAVPPAARCWLKEGF
jgi:hypothetical protein